jgi:hypothetical protein
VPAGLQRLRNGDLAIERPVAQLGEVGRRAAGDLDVDEASRGGEVGDPCVREDPDVVAGGAHRVEVRAYVLDGMRLGAEAEFIEQVGEWGRRAPGRNRTKGRNRPMRSSSVVATNDFLRDLPPA